MLKYINLFYLKENVFNGYSKQKDFDNHKITGHKHICEWEKIKVLFHCMLEPCLIMLRSKNLDIGHRESSLAKSLMN